MGYTHFPKVSLQYFHQNSHTLAVLITDMDGLRLVEGKFLRSGRAKYAGYTNKTLRYVVFSKEAVQKYNLMSLVDQVA